MDSPSSYGLLLVCFGEEFHAGSAVHVEFFLQMSGYSSPPEVDAKLTSTLDHEGWRDSPEVITEEEGVFTFAEHFVLCSNGGKCAPGSYPIDLRICFRNGVPAGCPHTFRARVVFRVGSTQNRVLEIDSCDLAINNLQGIDLNRFETVRLRGSGKSITNLLGGDSSRSLYDGDSRTQQIGRFPIKVDHDCLRGRPLVHPQCRRNPTANQPILLCWDRTDRRTLLFSKETLKLGRDRPSEGGNDIALRCLPRGEPNNDNITRSISCKHLEIALRRDGLSVRDLHSTNGTWVDGCRLGRAQEIKVTPRDFSSSHRIQVGLGFEVELTCFSNTSPNSATSLWSLANDYVSAVGRHNEVKQAPGHPPIWNLSKSSGLAAIRIKPLLNLPTEEYVVCFSHASMDAAEAAIELPVDDGVEVPARIFFLDGSFWIERLGDIHVCINENELDKGSIHAMSIGDLFEIGRNSGSVLKGAQHL